jgi:hypothetical protein
MGAPGYELSQDNRENDEVRVSGGAFIAQSFTRSLRDDFGIDEDRIHAIKVALTAEQVERFKLPPSMKAKETSSRFAAFRERHGRNAWELEALPPDTLADELRRAIDGVIDREAFEHEREQEAADAGQLEAHARRCSRRCPA